jgi:hypothetical protein
MELKAFKGMPHEFGGIDYTEGSEVEGGEFAVQIGKSGNEYIFDKNSSEGERLSKEYKRLDKNGRLTEDDPLALEAFDQIAREEALKHAQRSVNEKGVDPFRNMYDQAGQAANGGVKYATGGPMMNPAEVPNVNPGAQYNTSMSYAPKTMEEHQRQTLGESRMRDSFGTQAMREQETDKAFKEIGAAKEAGLLIGDIFLGYPMASFTGKSFSETVMADQGYTSSDATKRAVGDDTMTGTAFGYGQMQSQNVISNIGGQVLGGMADGGAMPKNKYSMGGGMAGGINTSLLANMASTAGGAGGGVDGLLSNAGASGAASGAAGGGGMPWMQIVKAVKNVKDSTAQIAGSEMDKAIASKMGEEYITDKIGGPRQTMGGGSLAVPLNKETQQADDFDPKTSELPPAPEGTITYGGISYAPDTMGPFPMDATISKGGTEVPVWKNGGAKPIYGYYANGGGVKKEELNSTMPIAKNSRIDQNISSILNTDSPNDYTLETTRIINEYDSLPNDTSYIVQSPGFSYFYNTGQNTPDGKPVSNLNLPNFLNQPRAYEDGGGKSYTDKIKDAERDFNKSLNRPMDKAKRAFFDELRNNPRLKGDDMYLDPYRHGMAGYYTADAIKKKMPDWLPESVANKLAIAGSTIAGVGHEFAAPSTERMGLVDALTEAGQDAYNNYVGAKMIEDVLFDREARQLMLDKIKREETYPGVVVSDTDPYSLPKDVNDAVNNGLTFDQIMELEKKGLIDLTDLKKFQNGGGKKKEDEAVTGVAVSPTGAAYSSDQMSLDNRGVGSSDFGIIPANLEQYFYTLLGGTKQFTEKDMTPEEYEALVKLYNLRKEPNTIGYDDHNKVGSTDIAKASTLTKLTNEPDIIRNLIGKAAVKDGYITSDYNFGNKPLLEILKDPNVPDFMAWLHNNSPFVDSEAMAKKDAIKIKMPN